MKQIAHTPTPWVLNHTTTYDLHFVTDGNSKAICDLYYRPTDTDHYRFENAAANAELIVRACNAYADLIESLELTKIWLKEKNLPSKSMVGVTLSEELVLNKIDAALAKAKAVQS